MKIWIITDYQAELDDCLRVAEKLGGECRTIAETELRGYMLRRFVQRERGNHSLPDIVISAGAETEHAAINVRHEINAVFNVKIGVPRSKPHYKAFDLIVSRQPRESLRLAVEDEARVLYVPMPDPGRIASAIEAARNGRPLPSLIPGGDVVKPMDSQRAVLNGITALFRGSRPA